MLVLTVMVISCKENRTTDGRDGPVQHLRVFYEEDRFAGWPANNGIWSWEDEILVGFVEADYHESAGFHTYDRNTARHKYARSRDGGLTWSIEDAFELGQTARGYDHNLDTAAAAPPVRLTGPVPDFRDPDFIMTFIRQDNNKGPSHFYYSGNRGRIWEGPFEFPEMDTPGVATRIDYLVDGQQELNAFITVAKDNEREGRVAMARTVNGGVDWNIVSWLGPEHGGFDIMPSSVRLSPRDIFTVIRTRDTNPTRDYLKAFQSADNGNTWRQLDDPVADTGQYGSPPALLQLEDGRLALAYVYRSDYGSRLCIRVSPDEGQTWSHEIPLRAGDGATADVGYPRMVQRPDGNLVLVYYWNHAGDENAKPYRYIAATIVDPAILPEAGR
ncbi:MAG: sialidase family protein [Balneolales bacterium]